VSGPDFYGDYSFSRKVEDPMPAKKEGADLSIEMDFSNNYEE